MKKIIIAFLALIMVTSCKKKYSCSCSTTYYYSGGQESFHNKTTAISEKMKKDQAKSVCDHEALDIDATWTNFLTNNGSSAPAPGDKFYTICTLE